MLKKQILIVEDEDKIASIIKDYLEREGFVVSRLDNGNDVQDFIRKHYPDLMILDLMLPGKDGITVCKEIRSFSDLPILMLTAKVDEVDKLIGLELGADDYITKPFSPREVVARVKVVLRRIQPDNTRNTLTAGPITVDPPLHKATVEGIPLNLTRKEFALLETLVSQPERVFSRTELIKQVQGYDFEGYDRTIDTHIKNLRKKISDFLPDQKIIQTIYGVGYSLMVPYSE